MPGPPFDHLFPSYTYVAVPMMAPEYGVDLDPDNVFNVCVQFGRVLYERAVDYDYMFTNNDYVAVPIAGRPFGIDGDPVDTFPQCRIQRRAVFEL